MLTSRSNVKNAPKQIRMVRRGFRKYGSLAPWPASWAAQFVFTTPRRFPRPAKEKLWLEGAQRSSFKCGRQQLPLWRWGQSGPKIALVHGWEGRGSQLGAWTSDQSSVISSRGVLETTWRVVLPQGQVRVHRGRHPVHQAGHCHTAAAAFRWLQDVQRLPQVGRRQAELGRLQVRV